MGSVDDVSSEIQLADERVVMLDMHGAPVDENLHLHATRILDPAGVFGADGGSELSAQVAYHLFQSWYDLIDRHLTDPVADAKRWDSANLLYADAMTPSDAGGELTCNQDTCQLDQAQCTMPGLDTAAGTMSPEAMSTSAETYAETETDLGAGGTESGGCGCLAPTSNHGGLLVLSLSMLGAMRRRRVA